MIGWGDFTSRTSVDKILPTQHIYLWEFFTPAIICNGLINAPAHFYICQLLTLLAFCPPDSQHNLQSTGKRLTSTVSGVTDNRVRSALKEPNCKE
jgi:hypothetical protein